MLGLNPGPLWEQYLFLTTESSLQHHISWQSFYLRYDDIKEADFVDNWKICLIMTPEVFPSLATILQPVSIRNPSKTLSVERQLLFCDEVEFQHFYDG